MKTGWAWSLIISSRPTTCYQIKQLNMVINSLK